MKRYTYFPGCSSSDGGAKAYGSSLLSVAQALGAEFSELEEWNCCGSTPFTAVGELASLCPAARNLALAEKRGLDLVTPCSACYVILSRANARFNGSPKLRDRLNEALAAGGLAYRGTVRARHVLDVFANDVGPDAIKARVKNSLGGLKVAPYYGCQVVRPGPSFDHEEDPQSLDRLLEWLGAEPVPYPLKTRCCGASLIVSEEGLALGMLRDLLESAASNGAECIATVCPLCQTNLDVYQQLVNKKFKTRFDLPVLFFTQLMGLAFGLEERDLGVRRCIVSPEKVLAKCNAR